MVIMDRQDYINKANHLLNQSTYKSIAKDPPNSIKNKLINILKRVKTKTGLDSNTYKSLYPTGCVPPNVYGLPKIHKPDTPLRPIVSSCGSVTYGVGKELAKTVMEVWDIILLLEFCLKNTYFSFQGQFYEQVEGATMGSSASPIMANLYMEYLEQKALSTAPQPPSSGTGMWMTPLSSTRKPINKASSNT